MPQFYYEYAVPRFMHWSLMEFDLKSLFVPVLLSAVFLGQTGTWSITWGGSGNSGFSGNPVVEFLPHDHDIKLLNPFSYTDPAGRVWAVPANTVSDGASIPRGLWTPVGGPLDGQYRDASIVHDYYCAHYDVFWNEPYKRDWKEVHRAFYNGLLARGVNATKAKLMYGGVYYCGPRWEWHGQSVQRITTWCFTGGDINAEDVLADYVESGDRSIEDIEALERTNKDFGKMVGARAADVREARPPQ